MFSRISTPVVFALFLIGLSVSQSSLARPEIGPPSIQLRANLANVAVAELVNITDSHVLEFRKVADLHNTAEDEFRVGSDELNASRLEAGRTYIIAFNIHVINRHPRTVSLRKGPAILANLPGADPAIFHDDENIRRLLSWPLDESMTSPEAMKPVLMAGLETRDSHILNFFVTELLTRAPMMESLSKREYRRVLSLLADANTLPGTREFMLVNGLFPKSVFSDRERRSLLLDAISQTPVRLDLTSLQPAFIRASLKKLEPLAQPEDSSVIARWLHTNSTGVLQAAMDALHRIDPENEEAFLSNALNQTFLDRTSREIIVDHMRRYSLSQN